MNFIEAVEMLNSRKCKGIKIDTWGKSYIVIDPDGMLTLNNGIYMPMPSDFSAIWQLVNPIPLIETVEVKQYAAVDKHNAVHCIQPQQERIVSYIEQMKAEQCLALVELTGTYQRKVKPKLKRREEINIPYGQEWQWLNPNLVESTPKGVKFFAEWEE